MSDVVQRYSIDLSGFEASINKAIGGWDELSRRARTAQLDDPLKKAAQDALKLEDALLDDAAAFAKLANSPKLLKTELDRLQAEYRDMIKLQDKFTSSDFGKVESKIRGVRNRIEEINEALGKTNKLADSKPRSSGRGGSGFDVGGAIGSLLFGVSATEIISNIARVRAEYETLQNTLNVQLGRQAGGEAFALIKDFADNSPLELAEVTRAFTRLVGSGIVPTKKELQQLTDFALSKSKGLQDFVEAIADAQFGEFERLKEFQVDARKEGDKIIFTYDGVSTSVKNTRAAISDYLVELGKLPGIQGQTEVAAESLTGKWSTLTDKARTLANEIGTTLTPAFDFLLTKVGDLSEALTTLFSRFNAIAKDQGIKRALTALINPASFAVQSAISVGRVNAQENSRPVKGAAIVLPGQKPVTPQQSALELERAKKRARLENEENQNKAKNAASQAEKIERELLDKERELSNERRKLQDELLSLERRFRRERLSQMVKDSAEYVALKTQIDLEELRQEQQKLIELGRIATGKTVYNRKTKAFENQPNANYALPLGTQQLFNQRRLSIQAGNLAEFALSQQAQNDAREERNRNLRAGTFANQLNGISLNETVALKQAELRIVQQAGEAEISFERRKQQELLAITIEYAEKRLNALKLSGRGANDPDILDTLLVIKNAKLELNNLNKDTQKRDLYDLLGIKLSNAQKEAVQESVGFVVQGIGTILQSQLDAEQRRIAGLDRAIEAKRAQVQIEADLAKEGLANNLQLRQQEAQELERQRREALQKQQRDQAILLAINQAQQAASLSVAAANIFKTLSPLGPLGIGLGVASVAAMIASFVAAQVNIRKLPVFHEGGEIKDGDGKNERIILAKKGEFVVNDSSAQPNKAFLAKVNSLKRKLTPQDMGWITEMLSTGQMTSLQAMMAMQDSYRMASAGLSNQELRELKGLMKTVAENTSRLPKKSVTTLPNGKVLMQEGDKMTVKKWEN